MKKNNKTKLEKKELMLNLILTVYMLFLGRRVNYQIFAF